MSYLNMFQPFSGLLILAPLFETIAQFLKAYKTGSKLFPSINTIFRDRSIRLFRNPTDPV